MRARILLPCLAGTLVWVLVSDVFAAMLPVGEVGTPKTFRELIARRPEPVLEGLAERSSPDRMGSDATEAFLDLLKLRELGWPRATATLIEILDAHRGSARIHGFAAAQALFTVNSAEAHHALSGQMLDPAYPVSLAFNYTRHWDMSEPRRSQLIHRYLLQNISDDLEIALQPDWREGDDGRRLVVTFRLSNGGERPLLIAAKPEYAAAHLYFVSPDGRVLPRLELVRYAPRRPTYELLLPGDVREHRVEMILEGGEDRRRALRDPEAEAALCTADIGFPVRIFGDYLVYAMLHQPPLNPGQLGDREAGLINAGQWWSGRVVSKPAPVRIEGAIDVRRSQEGWDQGGADGWGSFGNGEAAEP